MPLLLVGAIPETNEVEVNLWGGDAPALILGIDSHLAHHSIFSNDSPNQTVSVDILADPL